MREKDWLVKVLEEASERVEAWPDWKKSSDLQNPQQHDNGEREQSGIEQRQCA